MGGAHQALSGLSCSPEVCMPINPSSGGIHLIPSLWKVINGTGCGLWKPMELGEIT